MTAHSHHDTKFVRQFLPLLTVFVLVSLRDFWYVVYVSYAVPDAAPQADAGPGARGAHSSESCTGTDVDTGGSSRTKRSLSPGGTPQDAQSQVKRTKQKQKHHITVGDLLRFLTSSRRFS